MHLRIASRKRRTASHPIAPTCNPAPNRDNVPRWKIAWVGCWNWEQNRFLVRSSKTEHHENHRERIIPLFAELREELDRHFLADESIGNTFVIDGLQGTAWNLHEPFQKIADNAGLGTITRPFDNMRMSRSNEVWERWGPVKENLWIGHSEATRRKHYKGELSDEAFAEAAGIMLNEQHPTRAKTHAVR